MISATEPTSRVAAEAPATLPIACELTGPTSIERAFREIERRLTHPDVAIYNASRIELSSAPTRRRKAPKKISALLPSRSRRRFEVIAAPTSAPFDRRSVRKPGRQIGRHHRRSLGHHLTV